jgi:hypothetical protein
VDVPPDLVTLARLVAFAAVPEHGAFLSDEGLMLERDLGRWEYWCTPTNAATFASTGGDGVHFSLVDLGDGIGDASPVVMTVPMAFGDDLRPSWIVGETLVDFLALGLDGGWSTLEQLAYDDETWPSRRQAAAGGPRPPVLQALADELGLVPWTDVPGRLAALHERFGGALQVPPPS